MQSKILKFILGKRLDLFCLILLSGVAIPLIFYKLGQSSLVSWDEAWYAEIAKNILKSGDILNLRFNDKAYLDHPPMGFWLMAVSMGLFGMSEFWIRFPSALAGLLGIFVTYFLGRELFNRVVGFSAGLALCSSLWFLYRARSGNLDTILTLFFLTTIFLAIKSSKNIKFFPFFLLSLGALLLTKTGIPFVIFPALLVVFWKTKISWKKVKLPLLIFLGVMSGLIIYQIFKYPEYINRYLMIGLPGVEVKTSYIDNLKLSKEYLHNGIGKWFWPGIFSLFLSVFLFKKNFLIFTVFFVTFFMPFVFSSKGHIWHLVPLHPILILSFFGFFYVLSEKGLEVFKKVTKIKHNLKFVVYIPLLTFLFYFSFIQLHQVWYQFIDIPAFRSDEEILSREAGKYPNYKFFIDGDFGPAAVFYSDKPVTQIWGGGVKELFTDKSGDFVFITKQYRLDESGVNSKSYSILKSDRDKILIKHEKGT